MPERVEGGDIDCIGEAEDAFTKDRSVDFEVTGNRSGDISIPVFYIEINDEAEDV